MAIKSKSAPDRIIHGHKAVVVDSPDVKERDKGLVRRAFVVIGGVPAGFHRATVGQIGSRQFRVNVYVDDGRSEIVPVYRIASSVVLES